MPFLMSVWPVAIQIRRPVGIGIIAACRATWRAERKNNFFGVLVGYSLDEACQPLAVGWFALNLHEPRYSVRAMCISKQRTGEILLILRPKYIPAVDLSRWPLVNCTPE
jgi:hypothetical protein